MKITNKYGLPKALVRAIENDPYSRGECDFTVTELIKPPRIRALENKYKEKIEVDASDQVFSLLGKSVHYILEKAARSGIDVVERRFFADFENIKVSGQIDLLATDTGALVDFKVTRAYPFTDRGGKGLKPEWVQQLNMQLELLRRNGFDAKSLHIVGILRDWDAKCLDKTNKLKFMAGYPPAEAVVVNIPIWPRDKTISFIEDRISEHIRAKTALPECSDEDRWNNRRCESYCQVSGWCNQFQSIRTGGNGI